MSVTVPDSLLQAARMSEDELRQEMAVWLFEKDKLTLAQASHFAQMDRLRFQHLLASRNIPMHYDVEAFEQDLATLRDLGWSESEREALAQLARGEREIAEAAGHDLDAVLADADRLLARQDS